MKTSEHTINFSCTLKNVDKEKLWKQYDELILLIRSYSDEDTLIDTMRFDYSQREKEEKK